MSRHIFHMKGAIYSKHKVNWKKVLVKHKMQWRGDMERWIWEGDREKLIAVFDRDMTIGERGVTLDAYLMWEGDGETSDFKDAFIEFWEKIDGIEVIDKMPGEIKEDGKQAAFDKWLQAERNIIERMRTVKSPHTGKSAPEGFIKAAEKDLEEKITDKRIELGLDPTPEGWKPKRKTVDTGFF